MMTHTAEPWRIIRNPEAINCASIVGPRHVDGGECQYVADCIGTGPEEDIQGVTDARRIVACINFLRGVPTEVVERWVKADLSLDYTDFGELSLIKQAKR